MLRLFLLRHAKSSWSEPGQDDFDRPLAERGRAAIAEMAALFAREGYAPALIACSTARRTRETLAPLLAQFDGETDVKLTRRIYGAGSEDLLDAIRGTGGTAGSLMVIGHNPALGELADLLAGDGDAPARARLREKFPTAGLAVLDFDAARWADVGPGLGTLVAFHTPRSMREAD